uniref:(northern house mosquito) hypothetical protein n=1 Tax=Culex pipiens TaxID=7175 RepID=A0A8D8JPG3_CULPI
MAGHECDHVSTRCPSRTAVSDPVPLPTDRFAQLVHLQQDAIVLDDAQAIPGYVRKSHAVRASPIDSVQLCKLDRPVDGFGAQSRRAARDRSGPAAVQAVQVQPTW